MKTAYFASGCFWGTEYHFEQMVGVMRTAVGYMGGHVKNPTYKEVCGGKTGHLETTQVSYDPEKVSYEELLQLFFETHDFTQTDGQGPDIGSQYLSCIFYTDESEKKLSESYVKKLEKLGFKPATQLRPAVEFWRAEEYHQQYYRQKGTTPYCHIYRKIF